MRVEPLDRFLPWLTETHTTGPEVTVIRAVTGNLDHDTKASPTNAAEFAALVILIETLDLRDWFGVLSGISTSWWRIIAWWDRLCGALDAESPRWRDGDEISGASCDTLINDLRSRRHYDVAVDVTTVTRFATRALTAMGCSITALIPLNEHHPDPNVWLDRLPATNPALLDRIHISTSVDDYKADLYVTANPTTLPPWASMVPVQWRPTHRPLPTRYAAITPTFGPAGRTAAT